MRRLTSRDLNRMESGVKAGASVQKPSALGEGGEAEAGRWAEDNGHGIIIPGRGSAAGAPGEGAVEPAGEGGGQLPVWPDPHSLAYSLHELT